MDCVREWGCLDGEREEEAEGGGFQLDDSISPPPTALWMLLAFAMDPGPALVVFSIGLGPPGIPLSLSFSSSVYLSLPFFLPGSLLVLSPSLPLYVALLAEGAAEGVYPLDTSVVRASIRVTSGMTALEVRRLLLLLGG